MDTADIEGANLVLSTVLGTAAGGAQPEPATPRDHCSVCCTSIGCPQGDPSSIFRDSVGSFSPEISLGLLRGYLTASTAKDCSLMIALQTCDAMGVAEGPGDGVVAARSEFLGGGSAGCEGGLGGYKVVACMKGASAGKVVDVGTGVVLRYRISVVDLDPRSVVKIPKHFELDQQIVHSALFGRYREMR